MFLALAVMLPGLLMAAEAPAPGSQVTFSKDIAPIFQAKCQECHQPNSIAPMSLISYKDARPWAKAIRERVITRQMPPWHIDRSVGVQKFKNDMSLSDEQVNTIVRWVDGGAVEGDQKDLPPPKPLVTDNEWQGVREINQNDPNLPFVRSTLCNIDCDIKPLQLQIGFLVMAVDTMV